jgi:hypothetical protein
MLFIYKIKRKKTFVLEIHIKNLLKGIFEALLLKRRPFKTSNNARFLLQEQV